MFATVCLVFAFVLFLIGAFFYPQPQPGPFWGRVNLVSLGLAFWVASQLFGRFAMIR